MKHLRRLELLEEIATRLQATYTTSQINSLLRSVGITETDGKRVHVYRLLVSADSVPVWRQRSIRGIAYHQHLYTRLAAGAETDEIENWLNKDFETPAQEALDRVRDGRQMAPSHWKSLARFVAAQHVRTPARFLEMMQRWSVELKPLIEETHRWSVAKLELLRELNEFVPTDKEFESSFATRRVTNGKLARYYLHALERVAVSDPQPDLIPNQNADEVNLEHIRSYCQMLWIASLIRRRSSAPPRPLVPLGSRR